VLCICKSKLFTLPKKTLRCVSVVPGARLLMKAVLSGSGLLQVSNSGMRFAELYLNTSDGASVLTPVGFLLRVVSFSYRYDQLVKTIMYVLIPRLLASP